MNEDTRTQNLKTFYAAPDESLHDQFVVADVMSCSTSKLERDRWAGTGIPFLKIGRLVRYRKSDVVALSGAHRTQRSTSQNKR
jgi:hypothetical protein